MKYATGTANETEFKNASNFNIFRKEGKSRREADDGETNIYHIGSKFIGKD